MPQDRDEAMNDAQLEHQEHLRRNIMSNEDQGQAVKHVWTSADTYGSLAQKYYGSAQEPYWRLIYEHNKAIIGDHPNAIKVGMEIEIPPLPPELKK